MGFLSTIFNLVTTSCSEMLIHCSKVCASSTWQWKQNCSKPPRFCLRLCMKPRLDKTKAYFTIIWQWPKWPLEIRKSPHIWDVTQRIGECITFYTFIYTYSTSTYIYIYSIISKKEEMYFKLYLSWFILVTTNCWTVCLLKTIKQSHIKSGAPKQM